MLAIILKLLVVPGGVCVAAGSLGVRLSSHNRAWEDAWSLVAVGGCGLLGLAVLASGSAWLLAGIF